MIRRTSYLAMVPFLGLVAILQSVVGPRLAIGGVRPDLVLLIVMAWTLIYGSYQGILWAFIGGLWMDVLSGGPMGAASISLMAATLVVGLGYNTLFRNNIIVPFLAALAGSLTFSLAYLGILALVGHTLELGPSLQRLVLPAALYDSGLMLLSTPLLNRIPEQRTVL